MTLESISRKDIWKKIDRFELGGLEGGAFFKQLTKENRWSRRFARQAIKEYKKFMYLAAISDKRVTPPTVIDKVWHKHLMFTHSYWNVFCPNVLGKDIHHQPSSGTEASHIKDVQDFKTTVQQYTKEFNAPPPAYIWHNTTRTITNICSPEVFALVVAGGVAGIIPWTIASVMLGVIAFVYIFITRRFFRKDTSKHIFSITSCGSCGAVGLGGGDIFAGSSNGGSDGGSGCGGGGGGGGGD